MTARLVSMVMMSRSLCVCVSVCLFTSNLALKIVHREKGYLIDYQKRKWLSKLLIERKWALPEVDCQYFYQKQQPGRPVKISSKRKTNPNLKTTPKIKMTRKGKTNQKMKTNLKMKTTPKIKTTLKRKKTPKSKTAPK